MLNFKEWLVTETITLQQAIDLYKYKPGDTVTDLDLKQRYRTFIMQQHPDRGGDPEILKNAIGGRALLAKLIGRQIPTLQPRQTTQQRWLQNDPKTDIRDELTRAIASIKKGQPEDAYAAVSRLVDPYTGKLNNSGTKPILKTSLDQWLKYYKQGFNDYLEPILVNAVKLI